MKKIIAFIVTIILFGGLIGLLIMTKDVDKRTSNDTTEVEATVRNVIIKETSSGKSFKIEVEEYNASLYLPKSMENYISEKLLYEISEGEKIRFRVQNEYLEYLEEDTFINIVSLETEERQIFSLEAYNEYVHVEAKPARIACLFLGVVFLVCAIKIFFGLQKRDKKYMLLLSFFMAEFLVLLLLSEEGIKVQSRLGNAIGTLVCLLPIQILLFQLGRDEEYTSKKQMCFKFIFWFIWLCYLLGGITALM